MLFSENIYFLILFTLPAAVNVIYNARVRQVPVAKEDKSVELAECVVFCLVVFLLNIFVMRDDMLLFSQYIMLSEDKAELFTAATGFHYVNFMIKYFIINILSSVGIILFWYLIGQAAFRWLHNKLNSWQNRPIEYKFSDVWNNVFETDKLIDINNCIVKIERSGSIVTAGLIKLYSSPSQPKKEFLLYNTDLIKQLFEDDCKKNLKTRCFHMPFMNMIYKMICSLNSMIRKSMTQSMQNKSPMALIFSAAAEACFGASGSVFSVDR